MAIFQARFSLQTTFNGPHGGTGFPTAGSTAGKTLRQASSRLPELADPLPNPTSRKKGRYARGPCSISISIANPAAAPAALCPCSRTRQETTSRRVVWGRCPPARTTRADAGPPQRRRLRGRRSRFCMSSTAFCGDWRTRRRPWCKRRAPLPRQAVSPAHRAQACGSGG